MATVPALTDRTEAQRWVEVRDEDALWGDLRPELLEAVQRIPETTMEDELAGELLATRYERTRVRRDLRKRLYHRPLVTELGAIPTCGSRAGGSSRTARRSCAGPPAGRRRSTGCSAMRSCGGSRRARRPCSRSRSPGSRSARPRSAASPGRSTPRSRRSSAGRSPSGPLPALRRPVGVGPGPDGPGRQRVVLAAYGIDEHGRRELLDYRQAARSRRPIGGPPALARRARSRPRRRPARHRRRGGRDRGRGRRGVPRSRPPALLDPPLRNLLDALPLAERKPCLRGLRSVYRARTRRAAVQATGAGRRPGGRVTPSRRGLERDLDALLAVFSLPEPLRASLRTTNLIERAFRELRRRLRPIGSLTDRRSPDRILYGQVVRLNGLLAARPLAAFTQES